ncbi:MAG: UDP-N-acetylenolpyruvoylglucosamine reductase [Porphyromonadaceae bacterium CG2_30_38_12]|nr:MAG: UDP-N-acetylenolpyruvoylglucosamine reductase [Porphyromonadaceae bacterium CG2_30_38_12]
MEILENQSLLAWNTFGVEAKATYFARYKTVSELREILQTQVAKIHPILHIGSGSNLLFINNFNGLILHSEMQHIQLVSETKTEVIVEAGAGLLWDDFVSYCVKMNWYGIENLSLIPGETGAAAIQNIGAYGVEICSSIAKVKTISIETGETTFFRNSECAYGYRESIFKKALRGKYIVTAVVFALSRKPTYTLNYQHLEANVLAQGKINLDTIRKTVIEIRSAKLPDPKELGNAGSFFMNPIVSKKRYEQLKRFYEKIPHYEVSATEEKIPAGWLIEQCGWKGKSIGRVGVHDKQALVIVNKGGATGVEIADFSALVQQSVRQKFDIQLVPEVNFIS